MYIRCHIIFYGYMYKHIKAKKKLWKHILQAPNTHYPQRRGQGTRTGTGSQRDFSLIDSFKRRTLLCITCIFNFSFWNNYRVRGSCKEMYKKVLCSFTQPLPMLPSCITIAQYQTQEIYIGIIYGAYSNFVSYTCVHLCACVQHYTTLSHI